MKWYGRVAVAVAMVLIAAVGLGAPRSARASHVAHLADASLDSTTVLAQWGFGDRQNSYAWAMGWFKGKLYVGTGRDVVCVEKLTDDFYYPFAQIYSTHPEPSVHCARNPFDLDLRAEIWQYTPRTRRWVMVYRAANIPNPRAPGKQVAAAIAYRGMTVATDSHGHQALFVSGVSADEYIPELAVSHPPQLLRTYDGVHFQNIVHTSFIIHRTGQFTDTRPMGFRGLVQWRGQLYVVASTSLTGAGEVFRIAHPWSRYAQFTQISPRYTQVFELQTFAGSLYLGTGNSTTGYGVLRLSNPRPPYHFHTVVADGAGRGKYMTSVVAMQVYRNWLYVSAAGWYCLSCNALPAAELIRIAPDGRWQVVSGAPRFVWQQSQTLYPISGLGDGFDNIFSAHMWRMAVAGNALYVGTNDWSWLLQKAKSFLGGYPGLLSSLMAGEMGFDVWATCDGTDFFPVTRNAFGVDFYDFGVRTMIGQGDGFYIGSADHAHGIRIYHQAGNACDSFVQPATARLARGATAVAPTPPRDLLTDVQRGGTVLSWEPSNHVARYAVLRSAYQSLPFSFDSPMPPAGGFLFDDAVPVPAAPNSPGSSTAMLPIAGGAYAPIGTTTKPYFIDHSALRGKKYAYRVVAIGTSGTKSAGSNVQVVPDPRPPATYAQLEGLLPTSRPLAHAAAGKSTCAGSLAELSLLARTAPDADARELALRLERRLEYRDVAGGPTTGRLTCG